MRRSERLSLWESWREAPERARTLTEKRKRSDSIVLTKESAHRCVAALTCRACPLRHACGVPPLPKGEALAGRATSYWTPEVRYGAKGRASLQRAAASGQAHLVKLPLSWTAEHSCSRDIVLCSSSMNLTDMPKPPLDRGGGCARGADGEVSPTAASKPDRRITNTKNYQMTSRNIF